MTRQSRAHASPPHMCTCKVHSSPVRELLRNKESHGISTHHVIPFAFATSALPQHFFPFFLSHTKKRQHKQKKIKKGINIFPFALPTDARNAVVSNVSTYHSLPYEKRNQSGTDVDIGPTSRTSVTCAARREAEPQPSTQHTLRKQASRMTKKVQRMSRTAYVRLGPRFQL